MEIKLNNVSYSSILEDINMEFQFGKITSIIGANGSGKTLLLNLLLDNVDKTSGIIKISDDIKFDVVCQSLKETFFCETLQKELELSLENLKYPDSKIEKHIRDAIKMIGLPESTLTRDPLTLSCSELRMAALARALSTNPDVLILDEPTVGMSESEKNNLIKILKKMKRRYNKTIIIASQDVEFIHKTSDYIYALGHGKIIAEGDKFLVFKQVKLLKKNKISVPKIVEFENIVHSSKNVNIGYRDEINDLVKDILRNIK